MRGIVSQCVISKLRPHLALQSISNSHALHLDSLLASKIHQHLHFPFRFPTTLLSTPLDLHGLCFPSISRLNASLAVSGLHRDLTHHLPSFQNMALITLSDWTCLFNRCVHPLSPPYSLTRTQTPIILTFYLSPGCLQSPPYPPFNFPFNQPTSLSFSMDMSHFSTFIHSSRPFFPNIPHSLPDFSPISPTTVTLFFIN